MKVFPGLMVEHFCVNSMILVATVFEISCGKTDRQTDRPTDKNDAEHPDHVVVDNNRNEPLK